MTALTRIVRDVPGPDSYVVFDATLNESHDGDVDVTEHPVEVGANIADHVRPRLTTLSLEVAVTNRPIDEEPGNTDGVTGKVTGKTVEYASKLNLPISLPGAGSLAKLVGADTLKAKETVNVLSFSGAFDRVVYVAALLEQIRSTCEVVTVVTRLRIYADMVLSRVSVHREPGMAGAATFRLEFKKLRFVQAKTTAAAVPGAKKSKGNKPSTPTVPTDETTSPDGSAARKMVDAGLDALKKYLNLY